MIQKTLFETLPNRFFIQKMATFKRFFHTSMTKTDLLTLS